MSVTAMTPSSFFHHAATAYSAAIAAPVVTQENRYYLGGGTNGVNVRLLSPTTLLHVLSTWCDERVNGGRDDVEVVRLSGTANQQCNCTSKMDRSLVRVFVGRFSNAYRTGLSQEHHRLSKRCNGRNVQRIFNILVIGDDVSKVQYLKSARKRLMWVHRLRQLQR